MTLLLNSARSWRGRNSYTPTAIEKFTSYADSTALRSAVTLGSTLYSSDDIDGNLVTLDTAVTYNNHPTMRYDFVAGGFAPAQVVGNFTPLANAWSRTAVRFSPGFTVEGINNPTLTPDGRGVSGTVAINSSGTAATFSVSQQSATSVGSYGLLNNYIVLTSSTGGYAPSSPTRIYKVTAGSGTSWTVTKANASAADTEAATAFWIVSSFHGTGTCTISSSGTVATFDTAQIALTGSFISLYNSALDTQPLNTNTDVYQVISGSGTTWTVVKQNVSAADTRIASAFTIGSPVNPTGNGSANAYKFQFLAFSDQDGRSGIEFTGLTDYVAFLGATAGGADASKSTANSPWKSITDEFTSGAWYEVVQHYEKRSSTSARYRWWIRKQGDTKWTLQHATPWTTATNSPYVFPNATKLLLGRNYNQQRYPTQSHQMWYGEWEIVDGSVYPDPWNINNAPNSTYVFSDDFTVNYANTENLRTQLYQTEPVRDETLGKPALTTQTYNDCVNADNLIIAPSPVVNVNSELTAKIQILNSSSEANIIKSNLTPMNNAAYYFEQAYEAGFTPVGANSGIGQGYKIAFMGYNNANGRVTLEWVGSLLTFGAGWVDNGSGNASYGSTNADFVPPYTVTGSGGIWTYPQYVCVLMTSEQINADYQKTMLWTWLKDGPFPAYPTRVHYDRRSTGALPVVNSLVMGANYNQALADRTAAPTGIYWRQHRIYDLSTTPDPVGLLATTSSIAFSASSLSVARGSSTSVNVTIGRGGYTGTITPTIFGTYSGISISNTPSMTTGVSTTTITVSATSGTSIGDRSDFALAFSGIGGVYQIPLTVT